MIGEGVDRGGSASRRCGRAAQVYGPGRCGRRAPPGCSGPGLLSLGVLPRLLGVGGVGRHSFSERLSNVLRASQLWWLFRLEGSISPDRAQKLPKPNDGGRFGGAISRAWALP